MHLFDLLIEFVDVGVDLVLQLSLLILKLNHLNLVHLLVQLSYLLLAALAVGQPHLEGVHGDFLLVFLGVLGLATLVLLGLLGFGLFLGFLLLLLLLAASALLVFVFFRVDFTLLQLSPVGLNVLVSDVEGFFGVLNLLINLRKDQLLGCSKVLVDNFETLKQTFDSLDDVLFADTQVIDFDVEVDLDLVDRSFQQNHLLTLLFVVDLLALRNLIVVVHFQVVFSEGAPSFIDLGFFALVLTSVHDFFCSQLINLFLAVFTLNFSFFSALVGMCLVDFSLTWLSDLGKVDLRLVLGTLVAISTVLDIVQQGIVTHLLVLFSCDFVLEDFLEFGNVVGQELRHLRHSESGDVGFSAHGLDGTFLEVKDVVELFLNLVKLHSVLLDLPLLFLLCLFDFLFRTINEHIEEVRVDVEVLFSHLNDIFDFLVFLNNLGEALSKALDFIPDDSFFLLSDLQFPVLFSSQFGLLDGVDFLVFYILGVRRNLEWLLEVALVKTINEGIDLGNVRRIVLLESCNLFVFDG